MCVVNLDDAKLHFFELIDVVIHGGEVLIALAGKPVAKLSPIEKKPQRKFGVLKGKIRVTKDFDAPLHPSKLLS